MSATSGIRKSLSDAQETVAAHRAEMARIDERIRYLREAPLCKDDALAQLLEELRAHRDQARTAIRKTAPEWARPDRLAGGYSPSHHTPLWTRAGTLSGGRGELVNLHDVLCLLFADVIERELAALFDELDWAAAGPPVSARTREIASLQTRRQTLEHDIAEILHEAERFRSTLTA